MITRYLPETVRTDARKKTSSCLRLPLSVAIACIYPSASYALPQNPDVRSGSVSITTADGAMQINQATNKAIIDWKKFGIGSNESVTFNQPLPSSVVLNRVTGVDPSALDGVLKANGQVFIINPNGVLMGATAKVTTGALLASTLDIDNQRFLASDYSFNARPGAGNPSVTNAGTITSIDGGYIVMLSNTVRNNGTIDALGGAVLLGGGSQATLYLGKQSLLGYRIDAGAAGTLVENTNSIRADGGTVSLAARGMTGAEQLASAAVNNSGIIEAKTLNGHPGAIVLSGDMQGGRVSLTGKLDASAQSGKGGTIETIASVVTVGNTASVTTESLSGATGVWTITSANPVIGSNPNSINNTVIGSALDKSNVAIIATGNGEERNGSLSVNEEIAAQGKNRLTMKAAYNLSINAPLSVGSGGLAAYADSNGTSDGKVIVANIATVRASDGGTIDIYTNVPDYRNTSAYDGFITTPYRLWMLVNNVRQLQDMEKNLSGNYALGRDIDAGETASWNGGAGFRPIGLDSRRFVGQLDGMNHVISDLTIHRPRNDFVGLFSELAGTVRNLSLQDVHVSANSHAGAFAGYNGGTLNNVYATGSVSVEVEPGYSEQATDTAGGLVGSNGKGGLIKDAYSLVDVGGRSILGGIAGTNEGVINGVYAAGKVGRPNGADTLFQIGGLVGNNSGQVRNAYWTNDGTGKALAFGNDSTPADVANSVTMLTNDGLRNASLALDYDATWFRYDGYTAPLLRSFLKPLTIDGISREIDKVYDGQAFEFVPKFLYSAREAASSAHLNRSDGPVSGEQSPDVGTYSSESSTTFWSDQRGYLINNPVIRQDATVTIGARPIFVQASSDTKFFDNSDASTALPGVSSIQESMLNLGLANGDILIAGQSFDSNEAGKRTLTVSSLAIRNSAGKDVTANYQVSKRGASGQIVRPAPEPADNIEPDPTPETKPDPKTDPSSGPAPGSGPGAIPGSGPDFPDRQSGGNGQDGSAGPSGMPKPGPNSGSSGYGSAGGNPFLTGDSPAAKQRIATRFAYLATQDEDEEMKKRARTRALKTDATLSIRNGGINIPDGTFEAE